MTNRLCAAVKRIAIRPIHCVAMDNSPRYMRSNTVRRQLRCTADCERGQRARSRRRVIWPRCGMQTCRCNGWMISLRRSRFARNACSETPAIPFMNAVFQPATSFWQTDALPSCSARDGFKKRLGWESSGKMNFELRRAIRGDHPSLAGDFLGEPIVPGVVILDEVAASLTDSRQDCQLSGIPAVKLLHHLRS